MVPARKRRHSRKTFELLELADRSRTGRLHTDLFPEGRPMVAQIG
jgi:hypothetical protein